MPINPTTFALNTFKEATGAMKTLPRNNSNLQWMTLLKTENRFKEYL